MSDEPNDVTLVELAAHLVHHPTATMQELAVAVGMSRSSLHRRYPRRDDLVDAIAQQALSELMALWDAQNSEEWFTDSTRGIADTLTEYVTGLIGLGPQLLFIVRASALQLELTPELSQMDAELEEAMQRGQRSGALEPTLTALWLAESLNSLVFTAWEQVAAGRLAPRDAARSVLATWSHGAQRHGAQRHAR